MRTRRVGPATAIQYLPQDFDDHEWLIAPYYVPSDNSTGSDGRGKVYVLMHQESRVLFAPHRRWT